MMKKTLFATLTMAVFVSATAYAASEASAVTGGDFGGGTINFSGSVTEAPCSIAPGDDNQNIKLGQVSQKLLKTAGGTGSKIVPVTIHLQSCDMTADAASKTYTKAHVEFTGAGIDMTNAAKGYLLNSGSAKNVSVQLTDLAGAGINMSTTTSPNGTKDVDLTSGDGNVLQFGAHMVNSGTDAATPGSVIAIVTYKLKYS
ncbi:fimbrial protein [Salmonella enterica subsp. enterica serovar Gatow]|nr:fimbrial protein [Salmonella enterica subsp. enterica serovar Gatow]HCM6306586.1 fimbrial protein [Salmonella enterica subsp. enterica serovar 6,14:y:1,7]